MRQLMVLALYQFQIQMGNKPGKESEKLKELTSRFRIIQQDHTKNISLLEDKFTNRQCLLKSTMFTDQKAFQRQLALTESRKKALSGEQHVAALLQYFETTEDHYCSNSYKLHTLYEYPHKSLGDEIAERQQNHRKFQEKELWSILASCILGLCHLQKAGIRHQCLRPDAILLTQQGIIKVSDPDANHQQSNYQTLVSKRNTPHLYLSPQQCQALAQQKVQPDNIDPYKSDVFTLGMIMLEAGLLAPQDECYRDQCSKIHNETVNYNLEKFGQAYSSELRSMLELMLEYNEAERPVWIQLERYVRTGEETDVGDTRVQTPNAQRAEQNIVVQQSAPVAATAQVQSRPQSRNKQDSSNTNSMNGTAPVVRHLGGTATVVNPFPNQSVNITYAPMNPISSVPAATSKEFQKTTSNYPGSQPVIHAYQTAPNIHNQPLQIPTNVMNTTATTKDDVMPVSPSQADTVRPIFKIPQLANAYTTNTKIDENLVEVDEEDLTKTREPDDPKNAQNSAREHVQQQQVQQQPAPTITTLPGTIGQTVPEIRNVISSGTPSGSTNINPLPQTYIPSYTMNQQPTTAYRNWQPTTTTIPGISTGLTSLPAANTTSTGLTSLPVSTTTSGLPPYRTSIPLITQAPPYGGGNISYHPSSYIPTYTTGLTSNVPVYTSSYANYGAPSIIGRPQSNHYEYSSGGYPIGGGVPIGGTNIGGSGVGATSAIGTTGIGSTGLNISGPISNIYSASSYLPPTTSTKPYDPSAYKYITNPAPPTVPAPTTNKLASAKYTQSIDVNTNRNASSDRGDVQYVTQEFKQGSKYEGQKVNGMRHGRGKFYYQDGGLYDGEWKENKMSGHGKLYYQSGRIAYDGEWKDDQFTGHGVLSNEYPVPLQKNFDYANLDLIDEYWTKFEGQFVDDLKQGKGKLYLSNGEYFEGEFDRDTAVGQGEFHTLTGQVVRGIWNNNQLEKRLN